MRSNANADDAEQRRRDLRVVIFVGVTAILVILATAIGMIGSDKPNDENTVVAILTRAQYAQEAMNCPEKAIKTLTREQLRQVVDDYHKAKHNPQTSELSDMHNVDIASRVAYNPDPASSSHVRHHVIKVGFDASICGFVVHAVDHPGYTGEYNDPAKLPDDKPDELVFIDNQARKLSVPRDKICFSYAWPTVSYVDGHSVVHAPCDKMMQLANG